MDFKNYTPKYHNGKNGGMMVCYKVINNANKMALNFSHGSACYAGITYSRILPEYEKLETWFDLNKISYSKNKIIEWTAELNLLGFPCYLDFKKPQYANFTIKFADFETKVHFNSTLILIRALWETGINYVPDIYFQLLQEEAKNNKIKKQEVSIEKKFELLQQAHNAMAEIKHIVLMYNSNHMITYSGNGYNAKQKTVSFDDYKNRLKNQPKNINSTAFVGTSSFWRRN